MVSHAGEYAQITLKPCRGRKADRGKCEGSVYDSSGVEVWTISGSATDKLYATLTPAVRGWLASRLGG